MFCKKEELLTKIYLYGTYARAVCDQELVMIVCVPYLMAIQEGTILLKTTDYDNEKDTYYSEHIKLKYEMGI